MFAQWTRTKYWPGGVLWPGQRGGGYWDGTQDPGRSQNALNWLEDNSHFISSNSSKMIFKPQSKYYWQYRILFDGKKFMKYFQAFKWRIWRGCIFVRLSYILFIAGYLHTRTQPFINKDPNNKYVYITLIIEGGSLIKLYQAREEAMEADLALCLVFLLNSSAFVVLLQRTEWYTPRTILIQGSFWDRETK